MTYTAQPPAKNVDQIGTRPRRFWKDATTTATADGFEIHLDGRAVKTPQGHVLIAPTGDLANRIAAEWAAVVDHVRYEDMPLTRLGFAAVDRMDEVLSETVTEVLRYAETDLVCYPSEYPAALIARENEAWLPLLAWARSDLGLDFQQNRTLVHQAQPAQTVTVLTALIHGTTPWERAGLMSAIPLFGSVVLALAVWCERLSGEDAFAASRIGEDFQAETWGRDEEAAQRADSMKAQARSIETWFRSL